MVTSTSNLFPQTAARGRCEHLSQRTCLPSLPAHIPLGLPPHLLKKRFSWQPTRSCTTMLSSPPTHPRLTPLQPHGPAHCFLQPQDFAHAVPSAWHTLPPRHPHGSSLTAFRPQLKCHLLRRPSLACLFQRLSPSPLYSALFCLVAFIAADPYLPG